MEVHFKGKRLDEHNNQKLYAFEVQALGYEWSLLSFNLAKDGKLISASKEFFKADNETRATALLLAREKLASM